MRVCQVVCDKSLVLISACGRWEVKNGSIPGNEAFSDRLNPSIPVRTAQRAVYNSGNKSARNNPLIIPALVSVCLSVWCNSIRRGPVFLQDTFSDYHSRGRGRHTCRCAIAPITACFDLVIWKKDAPGIFELSRFVGAFVVPRWRGAMLVCFLRDWVANAERY